MNLNELFNNDGGVQWSLTKQSRRETLYAFTIGETPFEVSFELESRDGEKTYSFVFARSDIEYGNSRNGKSRFGITGDGDAIKVFGVVVEILGDFMKRNEDGRPIVFSADSDEPSRVRLYKRMIQQVTKRFPEWTGVDEGTGVFVIKRTHLDVNPN